MSPIDTNFLTASCPRSALSIRVLSGGTSQLPAASGQNGICGREAVPTPLTEVLEHVKALVPVLLPAPADEPAIDLPSVAQWRASTPLPAPP